VFHDNTTLDHVHPELRPDQRAAASGGIIEKYVHQTVSKLGERTASRNFITTSVDRLESHGDWCGDRGVD